MSTLPNHTTIGLGDQTAAGLYRRHVVELLFPPDVALIPQIRQIYELDFAFGEYQVLGVNRLKERAAYFWKVRGEETNHFRICTATPTQVNATASQRRKSFFEVNQFAVGYATHGLFPYRGKFHPQMIRAIMNMIDLREGETVLDIMAGCGTTNIEAAILGINSIGVELSPFACLMTRAKTAVLDTDLTPLAELRALPGAVVNYFGSRRPIQGDLFGEAREQVRRLEEVFERAPALREFCLLSYLDAMGYAQRRTNKSAADLMPDLLARYVDAAEAFNLVREELGLSLGKVSVLNEDARWVVLTPSSVDGIIFSPPYSFAVDYLENDEPQLRHLGVDPMPLHENMIGLRGEAGHTRQQRLESKIAAYFDDMRLVWAKCAMALKPGRSCVIVIGSNTVQTGGVLLEEEMIRLAEAAGLQLYKHTVRLIEGIRNTMRDEHVLFFRKPHS